MTQSLPSLSKQLASVAKREPTHIQHHIDVLRRQIKNYEHGSAEDRACLRLAIEEACTRLQRARNDASAR